MCTHASRYSNRTLHPALIFFTFSDTTLTLSLPHMQGQLPAWKRHQHLCMLKFLITQICNEEHSWDCMMGWTVSMNALTTMNFHKLVGCTTNVIADDKVLKKDLHCLHIGTGYLKVAGVGQPEFCIKAPVPTLSGPQAQAQKDVTKPNKIGVKLTGLTYPKHLPSSEAGPF